MQTPIPLRPFSNVCRGTSGASGPQATLILLLLVLLLSLVARYTIGDTVVSAAEEFGQFQIWGTENNITGVKSNSPGISILVPAENSVYYNDENVKIAGRVAPDSGRQASMVFYRVNGGDWTKVGLRNNEWSGPAQKYPHGVYQIEAVVYDDNGGESAHAWVNFTSLFRYLPDAKFVSDDVPATMVAGDVYDCHIKFENTGNIPWSHSKGYSLSSYSSSAFGTGSFKVMGNDVQPNDTYSFDVDLPAPATPGHYDVSLRMNGGGYGWFGEEMRKQINVVAPVYNARVVSIDLPSQMTQGDTYLTTITLENTGNAAWYPGISKLGLIGGSSGDAGRMAGCDAIPIQQGMIIKAGETYAFKVNAVAVAAGTYYPQFRMNKDGLGWFGETAGATVRVVPKVTATPQPTNRPPYEAYVAYGKFVLIGIDGKQKIGGPWGWCYDGPLVRHNQRSSYFSEPSWPNPDWDIGGPNGHYTIYSDYFTGIFSFEMNNGGDKGRVIFFQN